MGVIRLILALAVVLNHSAPLWGFRILDGPSAVQCFYIISGFYMTLVLSERYAGKARDFYFNRALRIFPVYWCVLALSIVYFAVAFKLGGAYPDNPFNFYSTAGLNARSLLYLIGSQLLIFTQEGAMFVGLHNGSLYPVWDFHGTPEPQVWKLLFIPQAWSLSLELTFYLLAPFLVLLKTRTLIAIVAASFVLRLVIYLKIGTSDPFSYRFFPHEIGLFLAGVLSYRLYCYLDGLGVLTLHACRIATAAVIVMLLVYNLIPLPQYPRFYATYFAFAVLLPFIFSWSKDSKRGAYIGELSYPIYVCHFLFVVILNDWFPAIVKGPFYGAVAVVGSVLFAFALCKIIVEPIDKYRRSLLPNAVVENPTSDVQRPRPLAGHVANSHSTVFVHLGDNSVKYPEP